jgi:hypothetical protein
MWVCRPDVLTDACHGDLDATELRPDGARVVVPFVPAAKPTVDCFYLYPTVDMGMVPGSHTDFSDTGRMREFTRAQVGRFGAACRIFAPLYRQMTLGTYFATAEEHERLFEVAFADVLAAFRYYLAHFDDGRRIALIGHSQGAQMIERLLRTLFDGDPAMRARLLVAMPIGGDVEVADGSTAGGTFRNIPVCTSGDELACVIAFGTFRPEGVVHPWPGPATAGRHTACVNPAGAGDDGKHLLSGAAFVTRSRFRDTMPGAELATTPFVVLRDFYEAWCTDGNDGVRFLAVQPAPGPGDTRTSPVHLDAPMWRTRLGLHLLDFQLAQDDLVRLIQRKALAADGTQGDGKRSQR